MKKPEMMTREDTLRVLSSEQYFLEHWILQFNLYSDMSSHCLGYNRMTQRLKWVNAEINKLENET